MAFAVHGLLLCVITVSMFWPGLWGFEKTSWRVGRVVWGIVGGCAVGLGWVVGLVIVKGGDGDIVGEWAWIDVVS